MLTVHEVRHANLQMLIKQLGSVQALADLLGRSHSQVSQLRTRSVNKATGKVRVIGDDLARIIEQKVGKPHGWMDSLDPDAEPGAAKRTRAASPRSASIADRLDSLVGDYQARAYALIDLTLRTFESEQADNAKSRSRKA